MVLRLLFTLALFCLSSQALAQDLMIVLTDGAEVLLSSPASVTTTRLCRGDCTSGSLDASFIKQKGDRRIYKLEGTLSLSDNLQLTIIGLDSSAREVARSKFAIRKKGQNGPTTSGSSFTLQNVKFAIPSGWRLYQEAEARGTKIVALTNGDTIIRFYSKSGTIDMNRMFVNGSNVTRQTYQEKSGPYSWQRMETSKTTSITRRQQMTRHVAAFSTTRGSGVIYGFASSKSADTARTSVDNLLSTAE